MPDNGLKSGTVKRLREGYGFIQGEDGLDYFLHWSSIVKESPKEFRELEIGDKVEFRPTMGAKGPRAIDVMVLS